MEKIEENLLFTRFGLCPDYKIMQVESEWVEYFEPPVLEYYHKSTDRIPDSVAYPVKTRLHLNTHYVELENGLSVSARFTVSHTIKMIFLQVSPLGEFGKVQQEMLKYYG